MLNLMHRRGTATPHSGADELFTAATNQDVRRASAWLEDRLKRASHGEPFSEITLLTPALAELLLKRNADNRAVRPLRLANYVADMKAGAWSLNGESIKISSDGFLNDGQHRCQAVVESGCAIKTMVVFGVARKSRTTLDQGATRSPGDYLGMNGISYPNETAAAASLLWQYETRRRVSYHSLYRPKKQQVQETFARHPKLTDSVALIPRKGAVMAGGASVLAFCHYVFMHSDASAANYFISKLVQGDGLLKKDPILVCRERLHADKRMKVDEKVELIFRAWNASRKGKRLSKLPVMGGELPEVEA
jgi:hypothetical protein